MGGRNQHHDEDGTAWFGGQEDQYPAGYGDRPWPDESGRHVESVPRYPAAPPSSPLDPQTSQLPPVSDYREEPEGVPQSLASMMGPEEPPRYGAPPSPDRRPPPGQLGDGMYRTHRPGLAVALTLGVLVFVMPALLLVWRSALDDRGISPSGVVAGTLTVVGLPMLAIGLYPLLGAGPAAGARDLSAFLRPPYLYALVGVMLLICAGLAAS